MIKFKIEFGNLKTSAAFTNKSSTYSLNTITVNGSDSNLIVEMSPKNDPADI